MNKTTQNQTYTDPCTYAMQSDMRQLKEEIASDLNLFLVEMMPDLEVSVDWVCERWGLDCTDELVDFVADCHDACFGNWYPIACAGHWTGTQNRHGTSDAVLY